jgi:hypothetical protein
MKKSDMVRGEMVQVDAKMAAEWLAKNLAAANDGESRNRKLRVNVEDKYYSEMMRGRWNELNGETIKFDSAGNLIDGQHRLGAQIRTGKTMWWFVAYNCRSDAFKTIDNGSNRKPPDMLSIHGEENCNTLAAALTLVAKYKDGTMAKGKYAVSNQDVFDMMNAESAIVESVDKAIQNRGPKGFLANSIVAFVHYMGSMNGNRAKADAFVEALCQQTRTENDQPIAALRKKLVANLVASKKASRVAVTAWCVKAWNAFYCGGKLTPALLRYRIKPQKDKDENMICGIEDFPKFANL